MSFEYPKYMRYICEQCALCCGDTEKKVRQILLMRVEAERISRKTLKNINGFAEKIEGYEPYVYRMKKMTDGKCMFLKDNSCIIYELRPLICKFYPFQLENVGNNRFIFTHTNECPGIGKGPNLKRSFFEKLFKETAKTMAENAQKKV